LASIVRHKRDDEDRSSEYDKLMAAEQASVFFYFRKTGFNFNFWICRAVAETRGIHSGKEVPAPKQPLNISEVLICLNLSGEIVKANLYLVKRPCNPVPQRIQTARQNTSHRRLCRSWVEIQVSAAQCTILLNLGLRIPQNIPAKGQPNVDIGFGRSVVF
jgi:hypothetical protein